MEKFKKFSAAVIAMMMACGMMASCGDEKTEESKADDTKSTAATDENKEESKAEAEAESEAEPAPVEEAEPYTPVYEYQGYDAFLMFGDVSWLWGNWNGQGVVHSPDFDESDPAGYGYGVDADITGDGEYTVAITSSSIVGTDSYVNPQVAIDEDTGAALAAEGTVVFCVDIIGLCDGTQVSGLDADTNEWTITDIEEGKQKLKDGDNHYDVNAKGDYKVGDITVTLTSIKCDGQEIEFDPTKIRYGNIEDNNNRYRIEIYNSYGTTALDPGIDPFSLYFEKSLEVTFTIEGLGEVKTFPEVAPWGAAAAAETAEDSVAEEAPAEDAAAEEEAAAE
ncbi:MAG: hypothetical protein ACI4JW_08895 [Oscillospiraceae bacterium]